MYDVSFGHVKLTFIMKRFNLTFFIHFKILFFSFCIYCHEAAYFRINAILLRFLIVKKYFIPI